VGVGESAAQICDDVVDASQRNRIAVAISPLNEIREPSSIDPFTRDEVLTPGRATYAKDARDIAVREVRCGPARFSKVRGGFGGNQLRADHANENRALGLLILGRPNDCLRVFVDLIDDLESAPDHSPGV
jgi:hypothetical protein